MLAVCVLLAPVEARAQASDVIDRVLAIADGVVITLTDVNAAREFGLVTSDAADQMRGVLTQLINRSLILTEVERYAPPDPEPSAVAARLQAVRARFPTTSTYDLALSRVGLEERHLRELIRQDLRIRSYLDQRFTLVPVNDDQVAAYYRAHPALFTRNGLLQPLDDVKVEAARIAAEVRRQATIDQWVAGLRRRAEVVDLTATGR
jgi:hypothetical protein